MRSILALTDISGRSDRSHAGHEEVEAGIGYQVRRDLVQVHCQRLRKSGVTTQRRRDTKAECEERIFLMLTAVK